METTHATDYFAPLGSYTRFGELPATERLLPIAPQLLPLSGQLIGNKTTRLESADFFTYLIMGLAVLIAIIVPLLNLN